MGGMGGGFWEGGSQDLVFEGNEATGRAARAPAGIRAIPDAPDVPPEIIIHAPAPAAGTVEGAGAPSDTVVEGEGGQLSASRDLLSRSQRDGDISGEIDILQLARDMKRIARVRQKRLPLPPLSKFSRSQSSPAVCMAKCFAWVRGKEVPEVGGEAETKGELQLMTSIDTLYQQAACLRPFLQSKMEKYVSENRGVTRGWGVALMRLGAGNVGEMALKDPERAVQKAVRCYGGDVSFLVDICRDALVFESIQDLRPLLKVSLLSPSLPQSLNLSLSFFSLPLRSHSLPSPFPSICRSIVPVPRTT